MTYLTLALTALSLNATPVTPGASGVPDQTPRVRQVVDRSLAFMDQHKFDYGCISCHDGPWMIWSYNEAQKRGFNVNQKSLDLLQTRAVKNFSAAPDFKPSGMDGFRQLSPNVAFLTLALRASGTADPATITLLDRFAGYLVKKQKDEGHWIINHFGKDWKGSEVPDENGDEYWPPMIEKRDVTTLWTLLALTSRDHSGALKDEVAKSRDKALKWLKETPPSDSLQSGALRVLAARRLGTAAELQTMVKHLLDRQNEDGGWSQAKDMPSDALGTGHALVALTSAGLTVKDAAVAKAWAFLLNSQLPDGSWPVNDRLYYLWKEKRKPKPKNEPKPKHSSSYVGTAWAVLGLVQSLPPDSTAAPNQGLKLKERAAQKPKTLDLYGRPLTDGDLKELAGVAELQTLGLGRTNVTNAGLKALASLKQLRSLDLSFNSVDTMAGLKELAGLPNLTELDFTGNATVTDVRLKELAHLPQLRKLNLQSTAVTDAGLKELAQLPHLEELILDDTAVTNAGLKQLEAFKQLKLVNVVGTSASYPGVSALSKAIPGVRVHQFYH